MNPSIDWDRVEELFEKAIELPEDQARQFLEVSCADQPELLKEVYTLVQSHDQLQENDALDQVFAKGVRQWAADAKPELFRPHDGHRQLKDELANKLKRELERVQPDFRVKEMISRGGTGVVYRVTQKSLGRDVAVKVLLTSELEPRSRGRLLRESQAVAKIKNDHVVEIFSVEDSDELTYLVMELIPGPTVNQWIQTKPQTPPLTAARIASQVARGLEAAHAQKLIHRDVKPANIILDSYHFDSAGNELRAKLIDFGIVRDMKSDEVTLENAAVGTPAYMSPEQLFSPDQIDERTDIYGLGMTLYKMLAGSLPFQGAPHMVLRQIDSTEPTPLRKLDDRIPRDLESICLKAINKSPGQRYASATKMREDLERFLAGQPTVARPIPVSAKILRWCNRHRSASAAIALAATLLIAIISGSLAFALTVASKNREITRHRVASLDSRVQAVLDSRPGHLLDAIENLGAMDSTTINRFEEALESKEHEANRKVNAAIALASMQDFHTEQIVALLDQLFASPTICRNLLDAFQRDQRSISLLRTSLASAKTAEQKARRIILLAHLGELEPWKEAVANRVDPTVRTAVVHDYSDWHGDLVELADALVEHRHEPWAWTLAEALCEIDRRSINQTDRQRIVDRLRKMNDSHHYSTFHFSQLAMSNLAPEVIEELSFDHPDCRTFPGEFHLVRVDPAETELGRFDRARFEQDHPPRRVRITRPYFISVTEVSVRQFAEFAADESGLEGAEAWWKLGKFDRKVSPSPDHPIQQVSWFDAVRFCNWLSKKNGLEPAYIMGEPLPGLSDSNGNPQRQWLLNHHANGFRLPTDAEWEYASRNHSRTRYFFGQDDRFFDHYGVGSSGRFVEASPVIHCRPNANGLYGMLGNVWEWVHNRYEVESKSDDVLIDPFGPEEYREAMVARVYQGGGINTAQGGIDSESRGRASPDTRYSNLGFRIALPDQ